MNVDATLKAGTQFAKDGQSSEGALHYPAVPPEPVVALDVPAGYTVPDTALLEVSAAPSEVVALVRVQLAGPASDAVGRACRLRPAEHPPIPRRPPNHTGWPLCAAPRGLGTLAPSMRTD